MKRLFQLLAILTLGALPVRAQITVSAGTLGAATGTSNATAAPPAGTAANDVAIVYCWARNTGDTTTVSGYAEIPGTHVSTSTGSHRWFWLRLSGAAGTATCNHSTSSDNYARMFVFRGLVASGNPWDAVNAGVSGAPDSNGQYTVSGITAGAQSMVVAFSGYEGNDEANIACTGTDPATYTASYAGSSTGSGGSINACSAIKSSAGATGNILVKYGNVAGSHNVGTLVISLTHACSGPTIGAHTVCGATDHQISSPAAFVSATYTPAVGNGVLLVVAWGGGSDPLNESITSIVNQDGTPLACFVPSPGSTFKLYSGPGTDEEAWAFYYCPAIPSSPSITAIGTNLSASTGVLHEMLVEFSAGTIQTTNFWDTDNTAVSSSEGLEASVSVTNTHANDLLIAYLHNGAPTYPNGGYPPVTGDHNYTAIVSNPPDNTNQILEARAVSSTGTQTATITWSNTPLQWFGGIIGLKAVDSGSGQATPTFTFNLSTLPAQTVGNPPFSVATYVTTNSTGAVTFALGAGSVGCTVTQTGLVTITGAAVSTNFCVIAASLASDPNYLSAGPISQSFHIVQATPTFTFDLSTLPAQTFGNPPFSIATYSTTNSTGAITFALGAGSVGCSVTSAGLVTMTGAAVGTNFCIISASLAASGNYLGAGPISQSFHIAQAIAPPGSITFVQAGSVTPQSSQSTVSVPFAAAQGAGDLNVVVVGWNDTTHQVSSISDTKGNVYTLAVPPVVGSGLSQAIYTANNIASATAGSNSVKVVFNGATAYVDVRAMEYKGADPLNPIDVFSSTSGSGTTLKTPSVNTTAVDLLLGATTVAGYTLAPGASYTKRLITQDGDLAEDRLVTSAGTYYADATGSGGSWVMQLLALRAAGGVVTPPPVSISISPTSPSVLVNGSILFSAVVSNSTNQSVTWSANAPGGLYTAPATAGTATVTVTSVADPTKSASATVTITLPPPTMSTVCSWLAGVNGATVIFQCNTTLTNVPAGQSITSVVTSGSLSNTTSGTHP